ncbi:hypothetical protein BGZ67_005956 [Mortierella alpina]|nr:hypothetical protein BGZ67_005956 [Mortierella alpina]
MPLLIHAVPLAKTWLGTHHWKTPLPEDLPEEMHYLAYADVQDRFLQLDKIALDTYPTYWPNIIVSFFLAAILSASVVGIVQTGTNYSVVGQGGCFLLPIMIVIWAKIRKETKARACKKFRHQSQKLLRAWTAQDTESHAMQWKLRRRPLSRAKRWLGNRSSREESGQQRRDELYHEEQEQDEEPRLDGQSSRSLEVIIGDNASHPTQTEQLSGGSEHRPSSTATTTPDVVQIQEDSREFDRSHPTFASSATSMTFSSTISIYNALGMNSQFHRVSTAETIANALTIDSDAEGTPRSTIVRIEDPTGAVAQTAGATTESTTDATLSDVPASLNTTAAPRHSFCSAVRQVLRSYYCCAYIFRERHVWLIEISLRECQLDEYVLTVPSPVYSAYRLPTYEDVIGQSRRLASARSSRVAVNRFMGAPPAYDDESDNQSEDEDEDGDGADNEDQDGGDGSEHDGSSYPATASYSITMPQTQMVMVERTPTELSTAIVRSSVVGPPPLSPSLSSLSRSSSLNQSAGSVDILDSIETNVGSASSTALSVVGKSA